MPRVRPALRALWRLVRRRWPLAVAALLLAAVGPRAVGAGLANLGLVALLKAQPCDPTWFVCQIASRPYPPVAWDESAPAEERARSLLAAALVWDGGSPAIRLHLAEALFALGRRAEAAGVLPPVDEYESGRSPLAHAARYEHHLIRGQQMAQTRRWGEAVQAFRLGLSLGAERTTQADEEALLLALAELHRERAEGDPTDRRTAYLAGKYLARAGRWEEALGWLGRTGTDAGTGRRGDGETRGQGDPAGAAWLHVYIGRALEERGELAGARVAYQAAVDVAPQVREAQARLLALLRRTDTNAARAIEARLAALGPGVPLGRRGGGYEALRPARLPSGWALVGYDVDGEALAAGPPVELLLWWQAPAGASPRGEGWLRAGPYWLQWQRTANLAPNAGFEWTGAATGLPFGYAYEFYAADVRQIAVRRTPRDGRDDNALVIAHVARESERIGVVGPPVPVDSYAYYLMGGQKQESAPHGNIGRLCYDPQERNEPPYYIAYHDAPRQPVGVWLQFADLARPFPGRGILSCKLFLIDAGVGSMTMWDDLLLARIALPEPQ
ncbi:MAG: hypothetical protein HY691_04810 [Chloroflexi bacterium]|nr:hypothetical protein [Chloroflexota bacterium]